MRARPFGWWRLAVQEILMGRAAVSATYTTFVSANYNPDSDGTTATTLTFTAKDANDAVITGGVVVTYA